VKKVTSSFRSRLALRFSATVMVLALVGFLAGYLALRQILYSQLDRSLLRLAEIEAAATADSEDESVHFHEELYVSPAHAEASPTRYAQVWTRDAGSVIRTRNLEGRDLPLPEGVLGRVASTGQSELFDFEWRGSEYRGLVYPLSRIGSQHSYHFLQVAAPLRQPQAVLDNILRTLTLLILIGSITAWALGWWLAGQAVRPVMEIIRQAESVDMNAARHRISAYADTDEIRRLVSVLNVMLARIDEAFENQRRFLADAGHEIKTPLTILRGDVEVALRKGRSLEEYEAILQQTLEDLRDVSGLAEGLITLARSDSGVLQPRSDTVPVARVFERVVTRYVKRAESAGLSLVTIAPRELAVRGDAPLLERALNNLVDNAIKYAGGRGRIELSASSTEDERVTLSVADEGVGIPREEQGKLFERFYRGAAGRRSARGSGLGLAIVAAIVEGHGGEIELEGQPGVGTTVRLVLPAAQGIPSEDSRELAALERDLGEPLRRG